MNIYVLRSYDPEADVPPTNDPWTLIGSSQENNGAFDWTVTTGFTESGVFAVTCAAQPDLFALSGSLSIDSVCGDGVTEGVETCDDGNTETEVCLYGQTECTVCTRACEAQPGAVTYCGDGQIDELFGERCDDGNQSNDDACPNTCRPAICGDGFVQAGVEFCDDGNTNDGDGCPSTCGPPGCGNGTLDENEECDDGNRNDRDGCLSTCVEAKCGDGRTYDGVEGCDDGNLITESCAYGLTGCTVCNERCEEIQGELRYCGDGRQDPDKGEICDDGNRINEKCAHGALGCTVCAEDCITAPGGLRYCGDGVLDTDAGETCDDGNLVDDDDCPADCVLVGCGNGVLELGEYCDDGNTVNTDTTCPNTCRFASCGDGFVLQGAEVCDDGNDETEDCPYGVFGCQVCDADCQEAEGAIHVCGDGVVDEPEGCDDGNTKTEGMRIRTRRMCRLCRQLHRRARQNQALW